MKFIDYEQVKQNKPLESSIQSNKTSNDALERRRKLEKVIEKFGDSLTIAGDWDPRIEEHLRELSLLPDNLIQSMKEKGLKVVIGSGNPSELKKHVKGAKQIISNIAESLYSIVHPSDWGTIRAGYYDFIQKVAFSAYDLGVPVALHEYGHGVGDLLKVDKRYTLGKHPYSKETHELIFKKLNNYLQQSGPGSKRGVQELIAESFSDYFLKSKDQFIAMYTKDWYTFLQKIIQTASTEKNSGSPKKVLYLKTNNNAE